MNKQSRVEVLKRLDLALMSGAVVGMLLLHGSWAPAKAQEKAICPADIPSAPPFPDGTACYNGQDVNGAFFFIAIPPAWNGSLLLFNHGGPSLNPPVPLTSRANFSAESFGTAYIWDPLVNQGWAFAASSYRAPGLGVTSAAEDSENLRRIFVSAFGRPRRTILLGESFGGLVAAIQAEKFTVASDGTRNLDAALLSSGLVAGIRLQGYLFSDQRTVYQYYCQNLPRPSEPQYELFLGVDDPKVTTAAVIQSRVTECTGAPGQRTAAQQQALTNIRSVLTITSDTDFSARMNQGPLRLADLTGQRLGGLNPFQSLDIAFRGSPDDAALNAGIARYQASEAALRTLINDGEPTGQVSIPVMTLHTEDDERAWPEMESVYQDTFRKAGTSDWLLQLYVKQGNHVGFTVAEFRAAFNKLQEWLDTGTKPTPSDATASCIGNSADCRFDNAYEPNPWTSRQPIRSPAQPPVDAAMYQTALSPGTLFSIFGTNSVSAEQKASAGALPTTLGGITVTINGTPAPLLYVGPTQINGQVPYETPTGSAISKVIANGVSGALVPFRVVPAAPRIFSGQGNVCIAQNEDGTLNSAGNPVKTGHNIAAYLIGLGVVDPVVVTGVPAPTTPLSSPAGKVTASLGGRSSIPTYLGLTPGFVGVGRVRLLVPSDLTGGLQNFVVIIGNATSNTCLIAVGK